MARAPGVMNSEPPRLLYIGDVPVEATYGGSAVLYRLFQGYPLDRLCIIETADREVAPDRRLPNVSYRFVAHGKSRWLNTRLFRWYSWWLALRASSRANRLATAAGDFNPEAVITLAHGSLWMAAARFARQRGLPLHVIVHDDAPWMAALPRPFGQWVDRRFGRVYREAASRLCVSPGMVEAYRQRHHAGGSVLYPTRAADAEVFPGPPERLRRPGRLVFAFAGTTDHQSNRRLLRRLADTLAEFGLELLIFGPSVDAPPAELARPNIRMGGNLPSHELIRRLRAEADVLYVPMPFTPEDRTAVTVSFPSKLTDYTTAGLPLLIHGPPGSSAVRWATDHAGVAEVVTSEEPLAMAEAVTRLLGDPEHRVRLARKAQEAGDRDFSPAAAQDRLYAALSATEASL